MAAFPPPPVNTIDWNDIGFRVREGKNNQQAPFTYTN